MTSRNYILLRGNFKMVWWVWLIIAVIFLVGELLSSGFFLFWFAIGAVAATLTAVITESLPIQVVVFILISGVLLFFSRRLTEKMNKNDTDTNVSALIGKTGLVTVDLLPNQKGQVKINGEEWTCISSDNSALKAGDLVVVESIHGVTLTVAPVNNRKAV